jgi:AraC-like DNA-binding protein
LTSAIGATHEVTFRQAPTLMLTAVNAPRQPTQRAMPTPRAIATQREKPERERQLADELAGHRSEVEIAGLAEPIRTKNVRLREYFERQCGLAQQAFAADPPFAAQVRQRLIASMDGRLPDMQSVARTLGVSPRSLHRRLADEGTRWNELLDEFRQEFAKSYFRRTKLSVGEVGHLIGFTDSSAFFKAFRRWTDTTPSEYRLSLPVGDADQPAASY